MGGRSNSPVRRLGRRASSDPRPGGFARAEVDAVGVAKDQPLISVQAWVHWP
jgi:hypothetical protein